MFNSSSRQYKQTFMTVSQKIKSDQIKVKIFSLTHSQSCPQRSFAFGGLKHNAPEEGRITALSEPHYYELRDSDSESTNDNWSPPGKSCFD